MALNISMCDEFQSCNRITDHPTMLAEELLKYLPSTPYPDESRKHWEMMLHCEIAAFPRPSPNLPLPSREARFYWHLYSAMAKHSHFYQKDINSALLATLTKMRHMRIHKKNINISDQLLRLNTFDYIGRRNVINQLKKLIYKQTNLETICLEGLSLTAVEGVQLILALYNSRKTMKYVYCWRAFKKTERPVADPDHFVVSRCCADKKIGKCDWFRAIGYLEFLTTLSVNYAYIATSTGDLLINLSKKLGPHWQWLQLLCLEDEIPDECNSGTNLRNVAIPAIAWEEAQFWAPALKVQYAIIGIPQYDRHKKFFTKDTPVHTFALSTGIDLKFRQPWYLDCTMKTLCSWYSSTLVYLCLHVWHNRENLDNQLRKLFINLPSLNVFEFIGEIRMLKTLCAMCCQIRSAKCNVRRVNMQLQEIVHADVDKEKWKNSIKCMLIYFQHDFDKLGVKFNISFYCC